MSLFSPKRKGRRIPTTDHEEGDNPVSGEGGQAVESEPKFSAAPRFGKRQPKRSNLRRSINVNDDVSSAQDDVFLKDGDDEDDADEGPVVVRPTIGRSGSTRSKKRFSLTTRLSVGAGGGEEEEGASSHPTAKQASSSILGQRVVEANAFRMSLSGRLPPRRSDHDDQDADNGNRMDDDDQPRYTKEYLEELQRSTPNTPQNLASRRKQAAGSSGLGGHEASSKDDSDGDGMELDPSEIEGAVVVDAADLAALHGATAVSKAGPSAARVLTHTEIQERKDRRARLALEQDAIALGSDDDDEMGYISLSTGDAKKKKKEESRLVREDEDLGEGFDEFVEDGGLALGRKAAKEERRRRKKEMAALIDAAEGTGGGNSDNDDDDGAYADGDGDRSDEERSRAYNAAQIRAGMDGLHVAAKSGVGANKLDGASAGIIPKMKALPDLSVCLAQMQKALQALENEMDTRRQRLVEAEKEKEDILAREKEVQQILDTAGQKYQSVLGKKPDGSTDSAGAAAAAAVVQSAATQSPLRLLPFSTVRDLRAERGLESLGTTPTRKVDVDDVF